MIRNSSNDCLWYLRLVDKDVKEKKSGSSERETKIRKVMKSRKVLAVNPRNLIFEMARIEAPFEWIDDPPSPSPYHQRLVLHRTNNSTTLNNR